MKKVVKFGGSSLASAGQFQKVGDIIRADETRRYVVPSAPGKRFNGDTKVTDMLYRCYYSAANGEDFSGQLKQIKARYNEIIGGLNLKLSLDHEFEVIAKQFEEKAGSDYAASRGEYLNGIIMANYLGFPFVDSAEVIRFDKHGEFDADTTNKLMEKKLAELEKAVIPGFYGAYADGKIKTFSRGGSDITGSIVAKAVKADLYENWTDVSGFLVTDPRLIENPETIDGIPINIRNTNKPEDKGTMIVASTCHKPVYTITGIAGKKGFVAVNIEKDMMNSEIGFGRKVLEEFEKQGISFEHMPSGIDTMSIIVHQDEFEEHEQKVLAGIQRAVHPDVLEVEGDLALVAVVGRAMKSNRGTAARIFAALAHANVNVKMIDQGSSEWNVIVGVRNEDFEKAIKAIYDIFVTTQL